MEAVHFLHTNAKMVHLNLSPENIYITKTGRVKLGGMNFLTKCEPGQTARAQYSYRTYWNGQLALAPNLKFTAPEQVTESKCDPSSDVFSIGCVAPFLLSLEAERKPFVLDLDSPYSEGQHASECKNLSTIVNREIAVYPQEL